VKYYETIFEVLARQYELAKLDEAREGEIIQVVDPAVVPDKRSFPKRTYIVLGSFAAGFLIAILAAFASAGLEQMERDPESAVRLNHIYSAFSLKTLFH
jgi:tyrosine-protein kinase Etk/Wzc